MPLERYLIKTDPYRPTSLPGAWLFSLRLDLVPDLRRRILPLEKDIFRILYAHDFPHSLRFAAFLATKPRYPGGDVPINLLCVSLNPHDYMYTPSPSRLGPAKDELFELFRRSGIEMHVDIYNINYTFCPCLFGILPDDPAVAAFEKAKHRLVEILNQRLGSSWKVLMPVQGRAQQGKGPSCRLPSR